jgi:hypothetical protein
MRTCGGKARVERLMARVWVVLLALLAVALSGCGADDASEQGMPAEASNGASDSVSAHKPSGTLVLRNLRDESLTVVDLGRGETVTVPVPQLAPGDPPFNLVETGGRLVFYGIGGAYALDLDLKGRPQKLGEAWYFVRSATEGRVWLALLDPQSPATVRDLRGVREVTVEGRITVADTGPPPCRGPTVLAAVKDGLVCQDDGLRVWDPVTGNVILELPGPFVADTHENLVAWCENGCPRLHLTDVGTGENVAISPSESFAFEETYGGAFSPDGSLLAFPVVTEDADQPHADGHRHGVALVEVEKGSASLIEGSELAADYPAIAWSRSGEWLFFGAGAGRIMAYRRGSEKASLLAVEVEQSFVEMAAG